MNIGSSRGSGGGGLARHWLKAKNEEVRALEPRGVGARGDIKAQVRALTAETAHATFAQPVVHFWFPPNPGDRQPTAAEKADLLARVEREFHLEHQPRIGCVHALRRDMEAAGKERHHSWEGLDEHEHYAWSLVREDGRAVDHMRKSMIRQQRVAAEWQHAHGFRITPMKHVTAVLEYLDRRNPEAAAAVRAAGMRSLNDPAPSAANVAAYRSAERSQMERSPAVPVAAKTRHAFNVRRDVLGAWRASDDGCSFEAALAELGYRLAQGARSALVVDPAGIEHRATELLGTAGRKLEGKAIAAAEVRARLAALGLAPIGQARQAVRDRGAEAPAPRAAHSPQEIRGAALEGAMGPVGQGAAAMPRSAAPAPEATARGATTLSAPGSLPVEAPRGPPASPGADESEPAFTSPGDSGPVLTGGGASGGDDTPVDALDASRPGDLARYFRQLASADVRKAQQLARADDRASKDAQRKAAEAAARFGEWVRGLIDDAAGKVARRLGKGRNPDRGSKQSAPARHASAGRDTGRGNGSGAGPADPADAGPERPASERVRGLGGGPGRPRPAVPEAAAGSAGGRAGQARAGRGTPPSPCGQGGGGRGSPSSAGNDGSDVPRRDLAHAPADRRRFENLMVARGLARSAPDLAGLVARAERRRPEARVDPDAVAALAERILGAGPPSVRPARPETPRMIVAIQREIAFLEPGWATRARREAWKAAVLRGVYSTGWLPPEVTRNVRRIQPSKDGSRVGIWLRTGVLVLDTCDRVGLSGPVDAIAVDEIVAAVQRRGWTAVAVTGPGEVKRAVALGLTLARPPVEVVNWVPLDDRAALPDPPQAPAGTEAIVTHHI